MTRRPFRRAQCALLLLLSVLLPTSAHAWSALGHATIAHIAENELTPAAKRKVAKLLGDDLELADIANWADEIRIGTRSETAPWHFINIPVREPVTEQDIALYCGPNGCIVQQIDSNLATLRSTSARTAKRLEALKFLVHLVGDLHQPLHCADDEDRGGNDKIVRRLHPGGSPRGAKIKLHALWDHLLETHSEEPRDLASVLETRITKNDRDAWSSGTPAAWAWESHTLARTIIYKDFRSGPSEADGIALPKRYYGPKLRALAETQLLKAGIRLAWLLNDVFGE